MTEAGVAVAVGVVFVGLFMVIPLVEAWQRRKGDR